VAAAALESSTAPSTGPLSARHFASELSTLDISSVLFFLLAVGVVGAGIAVVTLRNIIHSAVAMMVCFGSLAGMYALLGAPIVAAAQVLIYLGAISVLILFAIMLTQAGDANLPAPFHRQLPIAVVVALAIVGTVGWAVVRTDWRMAGGAVEAAVETIAETLLTDFALPFEIISLLLLAAIIGAIYLARRPEEDERAN
jgi:NADH:ubiquinone oxidoreductase subunit 6 (subunit J)